MISPLTERQKVMITNNVARVIKTGNIDYLTKQSYNFLYLANGFIAHYNLHGFMDYYNNTNELRNDILENRYSNQWNNFHPGENDYEYYMSKKDLYNRICEAI